MEKIEICERRIRLEMYRLNLKAHLKSKDPEDKNIAEDALFEIEAEIKNSINPEVYCALEEKGKEIYASFNAGHLFLIEIESWAVYCKRIPICGDEMVITIEPSIQDSSFGDVLIDGEHKDYLEDEELMKKINSIRLYQKIKKVSSRMAAFL
jgi:hypothetical protein